MTYEDTSAVITPHSVYLMTSTSTMTSAECHCLTLLEIQEVYPAAQPTTRSYHRLVSCQLVINSLSLGDG